MSSYYSRPDNRYPQRPTIDPQHLYWGDIFLDGEYVDPSLQSLSQDVADHHDNWQSDNVYPSPQVENGSQRAAPAERGSRSRHGKPRKSSGPSTASSSHRHPNSHGNDAQTSSKKRGKKPVYAPDADDESVDDYDASAEPYEPQKQLALERNRVAATKCRLKKKDEISRLAAHERAMEEENQSLSECVQGLRHEVISLKAKLVQHTDCNCVLIQKFISNEARRAAMASDAGHTPSLSPYSPSEADLSQTSLDYPDYPDYQTYDT